MPDDEIKKRIESWLGIDSLTNNIFIKEGGENEEFSLPKGFVTSGEAVNDAMLRILAGEIGWQASSEKASVIVEGYSYDARQTDHAWIEMHGCLIHRGAGSPHFEIRPGARFEDVDWWPLDAKIVNKLPASQAFLVREAVKRLQETGNMDNLYAKALLAKTG